MAHVRDRWTDPNPNGGRRLRNGRWGKGKRWQARWVEDGRERVQACVTKDEADLLVAEKEAGVVRRPVVTVTVAERFEVWRRSRLHHERSTAETVQSALNALILPTLGPLEVATLNRAVLQDAVTAWSGKWSASRVRVAWSFVTSMLKQAEIDGLIERVPQGVVLPQIDSVPIVPLTVAQVEEIAGRVPAWFRAMVLVGAASGLRSGELRGLTRDRCVGGVLVVDRQLTGARGGRAVFGPPKTEWSRRRVAVGPDAAAVLAEHLERWGGPELVFQTRHRTPVSRGTAGGVWRAATEAMGLPDRSGWHSLRHFHASMLIAGGMSPTAVASRLGHKDASETLKCYSHLWHTDEARALSIVTAELGASLLARSPDGPV